MQSQNKILILLLILAVLFAAVLVWALARSDGSRFEQQSKADTFKDKYKGILKSARAAVGEKAIPKVDLRNLQFICNDTAVPLRASELRSFTGKCELKFPTEKGDGFVSLVLARQGPLIALRCTKYGDETDEEKLGEPQIPKDDEIQLVVPKKGGTFELTCTGISQPCGIRPR
jgi:hypothetical protein